MDNKRRDSLMILLLALTLPIAACGTTPSSEPPNEEGTTTSGDASSQSGSGQVVDKQEPGEAIARVDGLEYSFDTPGGIACTVSNEEFGFSFIIGDNEVSLGGGATVTGGQWFGSLTMRIFDDEGVTEYAAVINENSSAVVTEDNSVSYSGPMEVYRPSEPGEISEPESVGDGIFSATCG